MNGHKDTPIELPSDAESVWRYMDLAKYLSMLQEQALHLAPLSSFEDPFEGSSPYHASLTSVLDSQLAAGTINPEFAQQAGAMSQIVRRLTLDRTYVSCWHLSEHESDAMWKLYSTSSGSIAIKTSCRELRMALPSDAKFGKVNYVDFPSFNSTKQAISYDPAFLKRLAFEHEHEVRIVLREPPKNLLEEIVTPTKVMSGGKKIPLKLDGFIDAVVINPLAPIWFADMVRDVTAKYGQHFGISQSTLGELPTY